MTFTYTCSKYDMGIYYPMTESMYNTMLSDASTSVFNAGPIDRKQPPASNIQDEESIF
jgi:hypothetical protein